jgi:hypothetical protein
VLGARERLVDEPLAREAALHQPGHVEVARVDPHREHDQAALLAEDELVPQAEALHAFGALALVELRVERVAALDVGRRAPVEGVSGRRLERTRRRHRTHEHVEGVHHELAADVAEELADPDEERGGRRLRHRQGSYSIVTRQTTQPSST